MTEWAGTFQTCPPQVEHGAQALRPVWNRRSAVPVRVARSGRSWHFCSIGQDLQD